MKFIIDMPDEWMPGICSTGKCPFIDTYQENGKEFCSPDACPLAGAKPAKEADINRIVVTHVHGAGARIENPRIDDKPVTLFAVEKER